MSYLTATNFSKECFRICRVLFTHHISKASLIIKISEYTAAITYSFQSELFNARVYIVQSSWITINLEFLLLHVQQCKEYRMEKLVFAVNTVIVLPMGSISTAIAVALVVFDPILILLPQEKTVRNFDRGLRRTTQRHIGTRKTAILRVNTVWSGELHVFLWD
jgi:hypothetical protein